MNHGEGSPKLRGSEPAVIRAVRGVGQMDMDVRALWRRVLGAEGRGIGRHLLRSEGLLAAALVAAAAFWFCTADGRMRIGFDNQMGILPVARRIQDPGHMAGDFGIRLRHYHHRTYAYVIAGASRIFGEERGLVLLHVAGMATVAAGAMALWRSLRLPLGLFPVLVLLLLQKPWWIGRGVEVNEFIEFKLAMMPPVFAHGLILAALAALLTRRWRVAAFLTGLVIFFHVQIGVIFSVCTLPFYWPALRERGPREILVLAAVSVVPAAPSLWFVLRLAAEAHAQGYWDFKALDFRQGHHHQFRPVQVAAVAWHVVFLVAAWIAALALRRRVAEALGLFAWVAVTVCLASAAHYWDYHFLQKGTIANFQFIRLTPLLTVLSVYAGLALMVDLAASWFARVPVGWRKAGLVAAFATVAVFAALTWHRATAERKEWGFKTFWEWGKPWPTMCRWISENTPPDAVFLTPPGSVGFTALARRSTIVDFKNSPDGAFCLREWFERLQDVTGGPLFDAHGRRRLSWDDMDRAQSALDEAKVLELRRKYGIRYALFWKPAAAGFPAVHETEKLVLMRLPEP